MSILSQDRWQQISPHLDTVLSLSEGERADWVAAFRRDKPELADLLEELLMEQAVLVEKAFLAGQPNLPFETSYTGQTLGAYRLISPIGEGGMGTVWLAERSDGRFERKVAIKFLRFSLASQTGAERFKREGRILGQLSHPHIAELIDAGVSSTGRPYIVLEYVDGRPIDAYCDTHRLDVNARIALFLDVLSAVSHAHAGLVVHRDIKPSNVLVRNDSQVKLLDFGIAKLLAEDGNPSATQLTLESGAGLTPLFATPEQITAGAITTMTDVYALGALLYLLLTGQHPAGPGPYSAAELVKAITETEPRRLSDAVTAYGAGKDTNSANRAVAPEKLRRQLRGDLDTIVAKALKKNPRERYASVALFADDLQRCLKHEPISARPEKVLYHLAKYVRRHRAGVVVAAVLLGLLLGFALVQSVQLRRIARERDRANRITEFMTDMFKTSDPSEARGNTITAREILDRASKDIDPGLAKDPELQAQMMQVMGDVYDDLGLYPTAESLLTRAVEIRRIALGPLARETLESKRLLGWILMEESRYAEAEKLQRETLKDDRRTLGDNDRETLSSLSNLGATLSSENRYAEAEKLQIEALNMARRVLGPDDPKMPSVMNRLSGVLYQEGRYAEAEKLQRDVLNLELRVLGSQNSNTFLIMDNLALTLTREGRTGEAEKLQRDAINLGLRELGPEHPVTLRAKGNLALVLKHEGRYTEAEELYREVLKIDKRVFGPRHQETIENTYNLGCTEALENHRDMALVLIRNAVDHGMVPLYDAGVIESDPDLQSLHGDPRFKSLMAHARKLQATQRPQ